ncbi:MAG TPA: hypothetical protein VKR52_01370, partial [Terracidiphilus sp.]|nr:hypothetical protein [Terracidiphilus sp.]
HFEWKQGAITAPSAPTMLSRFTRWSGDAVIGKNAIVLGSNELQRAGRKSAVDAASIEFGDPPVVSFEENKPAAGAPAQ